MNIVREGDSANGKVAPPLLLSFAISSYLFPSIVLSVAFVLAFALFHTRLPEHSRFFVIFLCFFFTLFTGSDGTMLSGAAVVLMELKRGLTNSVFVSKRRLPIFVPPNIFLILLLTSLSWMRL